MKSKIVILVLLVVVSICACFVYDRNKADITVDHNLKRIEVSSVDTYYQINSSSTMTCDLATFSNVVDNMVNDGFSIKKEETSEDLIAVILEKEDVIVRMQYTRDGEFASISSPYEKSYLPITYISVSSVQK